MSEETSTQQHADETQTVTNIDPAEYVGKRYFGRVKWFNNRLGYGFVTLLHNVDGNNTVSDTVDVFCHHSNLRPKESSFRSLTQGEYVELRIGNCADKENQVQAEDVTGVCGGPLLSDSRVRREGEDQARVER
jgi:Cold shock proteins